MELSHVDEKGHTRMVDVSSKEITSREAVAIGEVRMKPGTVRLILEGGIPKGDVIQTARIAGIMAAKRTAEAIPMCHTIPIEAVALELDSIEEEGRIRIRATVKTGWKTGVEMEALHSVSVAALTVYDMCKAVDKEMVIHGIRLVKKTGGKSGDFMA